MTFGDFVRASGLLPRGISQDGRWHHCPTENHPRSRNGAYKLALDGRVGFVQDWATQTAPSTWRPDTVEDGRRIDPREIEAEKARQRQATRRAIREACAFYASCKPLLGGHPYLEAHGLDMAGCLGLRIDTHGWVVIPAWRGRALQTVQRIAPGGTKRFWPGAPVKGASYTIDRPRAAVTVLCEGLATGLAIYAAVPTCRVLVAFDCGNMQHVANLVLNGLAVVAGDNDHGTEERIGSNPGIVAAEHAAGIIGCGVAIPQGLEGTDWCDLRRERMALALERRRYGQTAGAVRQAVDGEIAADVMRHARFLARAL